MTGISNLTEKLKSGRDVTPDEAEYVFRSCLDFVNGHRDEALKEWYSAAFEAVRSGRKGNFMMSIPLGMDFSLLGLDASCLSALPFSSRVLQATGDERTIRKMRGSNVFVKNGRATAFFDRIGEFDACGKTPYSKVRHEEAEPLCERLVNFKEDLKALILERFMSGKGYAVLRSCYPEKYVLTVHPSIREATEAIIDMPEGELKRKLAVACVPVDGMTTGPSLYENGERIYYNDGRMLFIFTRDSFDSLSDIGREEIIR